MDRGGSDGAIPGTSCQMGVEKGTNTAKVSRYAVSNSPCAQLYAIGLFFDAVYDHGVIVIWLVYEAQAKRKRRWSVFRWSRVYGTQATPRWRFNLNEPLRLA